MIQPKDSFNFNLKTPFPLNIQSIDLLLSLFQKTVNMFLLFGLCAIQIAPDLFTVPNPSQTTNQVVYFPHPNKSCQEIDVCKHLFFRKTSKTHIHAAAYTTMNFNLHHINRGKKLFNYRKVLGKRG